MGMVQTDLGWEADENFVVHDAGTYLCRVYNGEDRSYYKYTSGYAICAYVIASGVWHGPYLISSVADNTRMEVRVVGGGTAITGANGTVTHYNRLWYINTNWHLPNATEYDTDYPILQTSSGDISENARQILIMAGQQLLRTDKTWSFLAGLSAGLTSRSLPKLEG